MVFNWRTSSNFFVQRLWFSITFHNTDVLVLSHPIHPFHIIYIYTLNTQLSLMWHDIYYKILYILIPHITQFIEIWKKIFVSLSLSYKPQNFHKIIEINILTTNTTTTTLSQQHNKHSNTAKQLFFYTEQMISSSNSMHCVSNFS